MCECVCGLCGEGRNRTADSSIARSLFVRRLVGVHRANVLLGLHLVAAFHRNVFEVGIHREILAVTDNDHCVGTCQFGDAGHLAVEDGSCLSVFSCGDVDAVVGHRDLVRDHRGVFAKRRGNHTTLHRPRQLALIVDEVGGKSFLGRSQGHTFFFGCRSCGIALVGIFLGFFLALSFSLGISLSDFFGDDALTYGAHDVL